MLNNQGFTLLEGIVAIFLITLGVGGIYVLITQTISSTTLSSQKLIASYLVQEGIEIVRNIRDGNWLEGRAQSVSWDNGLEEGDWEADYNTQELTDSYDGDFLNLENGLYSYSSGKPTPFKRKISISKTDLDGDGTSDRIEIVVKVEWKERRRTHSLQAAEYLYSWH